MGLRFLFVRAEDAQAHIFLGLRIGDGWDTQSQPLVLTEHPGRGRLEAFV